MGQIVELDSRVVPLEKKLKVAGTAVVAAAASGVVIVGGLSIIAAVGIGLVALAAVNFGIPVGARYIALKKQQSLTALAETYSEETIRNDEIEEGNRVAEQQQLFQTQSAEFGNVADELRTNLADCNQAERELIEGQISELDRILSEAEAAVQAKIADFAELKRVNKLYISLNRAAKVMKRSQDLERNAQEIQRVETARNAIKTRMREAHAGQKLAAMNAPLKERLSVSGVIKIAAPANSGAQPFVIKEAQHVPVRR